MVTIKLDNLQLDVKVSVKVTQEMIDNLPKSQYICGKTDSGANVDTNVDLDISSDKTEAYWSHEDDTGGINKKATELEPKHRLIHSHPSKRIANFSFSVHGIWRM